MNHLSHETVRQTLKKRDQALAEQAVVHSADWQFTTGDARIKLKKLYPSIDG